MERDCQWEGIVCTLEEHMGVCEFTLVPCPKKCKQGNFITKRDLQQHLEEECPNRDYSCEHCDLKGTYATTLDHYDTCEKKIITCKYKSIGCDAKLKRKNMRAHEQDDEAHLNKTVDTVVKLREKMAKLQNDNNMLREETAKSTKENSDRLEAKLVKMQNEMGKLLREKDELEDKVARSQFTMRKEMAESLKNKEDKLNKAINMNRYLVIAVVILLAGIGYPLYDHYHDIQAILQQQKSIQATVQQQVDGLQETLQQQVDDQQETLQQQVDDLQVTKYHHDSMTFKLTDYQRKMDNNVRYSSPLFYTSHNGYNMKIRVYANGAGKGKGSHVSVYTCIVSGKYDDDLNWPFVGDVTFQLLNQLEDKNHHFNVLNVTTQVNMTLFSDFCLGSSKFYSIHSLLHDSTSTTQYLKNDTLYFRISAQASGHRPWLKCMTDMENEMEKKIVEVVKKSHIKFLYFRVPVDITLDPEL